THDQTEAMTMGDRIVVMKDGLIQQVDTPQNLYDYPCNIFVAGFIGSPQMNFLDGTLQKSGDQYTVDLAGTTIPLPKEKTADGKLDAYVGKT
ncbi:sugar ABC transporter ATP-binding protein, partial [Bacillus safensis]|nr:sugar ABC transporter ATP-binding protein [Bacillus safensis]